MTDEQESLEAPLTADVQEALDVAPAPYYRSREPRCKQCGGGRLAPCNLWNHSPVHSVHAPQGAGHHEFVVREQNEARDYVEWRWGKRQIGDRKRLTLAYEAGAAAVRGEAEARKVELQREIVDLAHDLGIQHQRAVDAIAERDVAEARIADLEAAVRRYVEIIDEALVVADHDALPPEIEIEASVRLTALRALLAAPAAPLEDRDA